jgi:hypothetical protein
MKSITRPALLVVEGKRDQYFFFELAKWMDEQNPNLEDTFLNVVTIEQAGGKSKELLRDVLATLKITPGFNQLRSMGIVRDADDNPTGAFQSVQHSLRETGFSAPDKIMTLAGGEPQVGVMIIPSVDQVGYLEDLCLAAFESEVVSACVDDYITCLEDKDMAPREVVRAKAKFQTLLAAKEPDLTPENAFGKSWFPWEHTTFDDMKQFLTLLADATTTI